MTNDDLEARERILQATIEILNEDNNPENITIRQIAIRAKVGVGLINYHFQSKENLLQVAVARVGGEIADQWENTLDSTIEDPLDRLKSMLKANASVAIHHHKFAGIAIRYELLQGEMSVCQVIVPVLTEIFRREKTEQELKVISFMLVTSMQFMFIRDRAFKKYTAIDIFNDKQRDHWIDLMVDNLISRKV